MVGHTGAFREEGFAAIAPGAYAAVVTTVVVASRRGSKLLPAGDLGVAAPLLLPLTLCSSALLLSLLQTLKLQSVGRWQPCLRKWTKRSRTGSVVCST